jgi:hypothetical protein
MSCDKINCNLKCKMEINGIPVVDWCKFCVCLNILPKVGCCRTLGNRCLNQYRTCKHRPEILNEFSKRGYGFVDV